jgi:hypothetical protein
LETDISAGQSCPDQSLPEDAGRNSDVTVKTPNRLRNTGAALVALVASLVFAGVAQAAAPTITSFAPTSGSLGSSTTITGTNFLAGAPLTQNTVKFGGSGGTAATVTAATATTITVTVPAGIAVTSTIYVSNTNGNVTSGSSFTVTAPTISTVTANADIGASITITGTNFNTTPASNTVKLGGSAGTAATVTAATATQLTVTVPNGAPATGAVYVSNSYGNVTGGTFTVNPTTITSFTPVKQATGSSITITGTNFHTTLASNSVIFNGSGGQAGTVTAATPTSLTVTVPGTATPGKIYVSTPYGNATSSADFFVIPTGYAATDIVAGRLTLGAASSIAIPAGDTAIYLFDTTAANQKVQFRWTNSTIGSMAIQVMGPTGSFVVASTAGTGSNFIDASALATQGTYAVQITPDPTFSGSLSLTASIVPTDVTSSVTASAAGGSTTLALTTPGQNGRVTFTGLGDHRYFIKFSASTITGGTGMLLDSNGAPMTAVSVSKLDTFIDTITVPTLPASGTYTVVVDPSGTNSGSVTVTVYDLGTADPAPVALGSITPSGVQTVTTSSPGVNAGITFPAVAGHKVSIKMTGNTYASVGLRLLKPDASQLGLAVTARTATFFMDAQTIPTTGTYKLVIDPVGANTGSATFTFYDITADVTGSVTLTSPAPSSATGSVSVTVPGQNGLVSFAGTAGMRVAVSITSTTLTSGTISILRPGGSVLKTGGLSKGAFLDVATLDVTGTHQILFDPSDSGTGTVTFAVYNVPADIGSPTPIAITPQQSLTGGTGSAVITTPGQDAWFSFAGTAGQRIAYKVAGTFIKSGALDITDPSDQPLGTSVAFGTGGGWGDPVTLPATGTYKIHAQANGVNTGNIVVSLFIVPADVTAAVTAGGPATTVTTTIPGQNAKITFAGTAGHGAMVQVSASTISGTVKLMRADGTTMLASASVTSTGGLIDATALPATETYTVLLDPKSFGTGTASVKVIDVPADVTGTLTMNGVQQVLSTTAPGQNITLTMAGTAGQKVAILVSAPAFSGSLKITRPDATVMLTKSFTASGAFVDATALTITGTNTVKIDPSGAGFGAVTVTAYNVPADAVGTPLVVDGAAQRLTATVPGQNGTITFSANAQDVVKITASSVSTGTSTCCGSKVSVIGPLGTTVMLAKSVGTNGAAWTLTLPSTGTYTIKMDPQSNAIGGITFAVASA